jgi:hypothetical protein
MQRRHGALPGALGSRFTLEGYTMAKKEELDEETMALINWCIEVERHLVAGGATQKQAQEHIEEQVEWFTDLFYDGLTPEEAAKEALA